MVNTSMNFVNLAGSRFLMKGINILCDYSPYFTLLFQSCKEKMRIRRGDIRKFLEKVSVETKKERGILIKKITFEYLFRFRNVQSTVYPPGAPKVRNPRIGRKPRSA